MSPFSLLIFDDGCGRWGGMTDLRPVFDLRTGAYTTRERIERSVGIAAAALVVPAAQAGLAQQQASPVTVYGPPKRGQWLLVNGRWGGIAAEKQVRELPLGSALVQPDGQLIAAHIEHDQPASLFNDGDCQLPQETMLQEIAEPVLLERPWHIFDQLNDLLGADLGAADFPDCDCSRYDAVRFGDCHVRVAPDVWLQPKVVFNATQGPIVVDHRALIGAMSVLEGPCYIGPYSQVSCHAHIRPYTVIGPVCKAAGEISHSIIHGYTNKGHHGYLGHSLVGEWVNLGAATNVSNLKNTYSPVRMKLAADTQSEDTGRQYQGPLIGDFTRTAIGTRLLTGTCVGTGTMLARSGYPPGFIDRFSFITDTETQRYDIDKFIVTAKKMMARRERQMSQSLENRLRSLAQSQADRVSRAA